jgi:excisionase family DNA binding protein
MAEGRSEAMLTPREAAKRVGVSVSLIYAWVEARLIPHYRAGLKGRGGKILIAEGDLLAFWESLKVEAAPAERHAPTPPKAKIKFRHLKF